MKNFITEVKWFLKDLKRLPKATYLCWKYPFLKGWNKKNKLFHTWCYYYAIPKGWRKSFGISLIKEIADSLKRHDIKLSDYVISDIKEKWGVLHWYDCGAPVEVHKIIHKYEEISMYTCITCGRPATVRTTGWISPYCDLCVPENEYYIHFGHKNGPTWYGWSGNIDNIPEDVWNDEEELLNSRDGNNNSASS